MITAFLQTVIIVSWMIMAPIGAWDHNLPVMFVWFIIGAAAFAGSETIRS